MLTTMPRRLVRLKTWSYYVKLLIIHYSEMKLILAQFIGFPKLTESPTLTATDLTNPGIGAIIMALMSAFGL